MIDIRCRDSCGGVAVVAALAVGPRPLELIGGNGVGKPVKHIPAFWRAVGRRERIRERINAFGTTHGGNSFPAFAKMPAQSFDILSI